MFLQILNWRKIPVLYICMFSIVDLFRRWKIFALLSYILNCLTQKGVKNLKNSGRMKKWFNILVLGSQSLSKTAWIKCIFFKSRHPSVEARPTCQDELIFQQENLPHDSGQPEGRGAEREPAPGVPAALQQAHRLRILHLGGVSILWPWGGGGTGNREASIDARNRQIM